jgi:hypothetical protein
LGGSVVIALLFHSLEDPPSFSSPALVVGHGGCLLARVTAVPP